MFGLAPGVYVNICGNLPLRELPDPVRVPGLGPGAPGFTLVFPTGSSHLGSSSLPAPALYKAHRFKPFGLKLFAGPGLVQG